MIAASSAPGAGGKFGRQGTAAIALVLTVAWAFSPLLSSDFIRFDDDQYVVRNAHVLKGITVDSVRWAFVATEAANWHPLTWISHMLDIEMFGLRPGGHHAVNLLLHLVNTVLVFRVLLSLTGAVWPCAFVAALFGVHPLHVESVAWVAERKDVLSAFFWLLTNALWVRFLRTRRKGASALAVLTFALGLMAKPMLVTLPFSLLLLDFWPLRRFASSGRTGLGSAWARLVAEKIPFFLLAALSAAITYHVQSAAGAVATGLDVADRLLNAAYAYLRYLVLTVRPADLSFFYPHLGGRELLIRGGVSAILLVAATVFLLLSSGRRPCLGVGWLWYGGTLVPVIGIVQAGSQGMADRYTYIPLIGIFVLVAWGLPSLLPRGSRLRRALPAAAVAVVAALTLATRGQVGHWRDAGTLFTHAAQVTDGNYVAVTNLGNLHRINGRLDEALGMYRAALTMNPAYEQAWYNLGLALMSAREDANAERAFRQAVSLQPRYAEAWNNLGVLLARGGRYSEAIPVLETAVRLRPGHAETGENLRLARERAALAAR